jgi:hypothetical protein
MIGVLVGYLIKENVGGKRSKIGVHGPDGRLLSFWDGFLFFSGVAIATSFATDIVVSIVSGNLPVPLGFIIACLGVALFLTRESYSR